MDNYNSNFINVNNNKNKKILSVLVAIITIVVIALFIIFFVKNRIKSQTIKESDESNGIFTISSTYLSQNGIPKFIEGDFNNITVIQESDVYEVLNSIKSDLKIKDVHTEFELDKIENGESFNYYRVNQLYNWIKVYGNNLIITTDKSGKVISVNGYYSPDVNVNTSNKKTKEEIELIIHNDLNSDFKINKIDEYIMVDNVNQDLVYMYNVYNDNALLQYIIDAKTGEIINKVDLYDSASYSYTGVGIDNIEYTISLEEDNGFLARNYYRFYDSNRKISIYDFRSMGSIVSTIISPLTNILIEPIRVKIVDSKIVSNENETFIKSAITTMKNYEDIYDYYKNMLGRDSYDNKGSEIKINLGVSNKTLTNEDLNNAFWSSLTDQMYIGNYNGKSLSASKDALAHEFTHGVIQHTANFISSQKKEDKGKAFETGALNEGIADILGSLIEGKNWTIAENNEILRDLENPEKYNFPKEKDGKYYFPADESEWKSRAIKRLQEQGLKSEWTSYDKGGVHINSNVVGHAAYLMYNNGAFFSKEQMAKVWYNALFLMPSSANFEDCALAVIKTAKNMNLSSKSIKVIEQAFIDTKMLEIKQFNFISTVKNGNNNIDNVSVKIYDGETKKLLYEMNTNKNGTINKELKSGMYLISFQKDGFKNCEKVINLLGNMTLNVELFSIKQTDDSSESQNIDQEMENNIENEEKENQKNIIYGGKVRFQHMNWYTLFNIPKEYVISLTWPNDYQESKEYLDLYGYRSLQGTGSLTGHTEDYENRESGSYFYITVEEIGISDKNKILEKYQGIISSEKERSFISDGYASTTNINGADVIYYLSNHMTYNEMEASGLIFLSDNQKEKIESDNKGLFAIKVSYYNYNNITMKELYSSFEKIIESYDGNYYHSYGTEDSDYTIIK